MILSFMGTPEFALPCLAALHQSHHKIALVITAPDKPAGRGQKAQASPVKQKALELGLEVMQPNRLKDPDFIQYFQSLQLDLNVVVAFRMLPELVWGAPSLGTINLHASLLPAFRGAAPIQWAIASGTEVTGLTTFRLAHEIDTGDVLLQEEISLDGKETGGSLYAKMMESGPHLLLRTLEGLEKGMLEGMPQATLAKLPHRKPSEAPKLQKSHGWLQPGQSAEEAERFVRAFNPIPGAQLNLVFDGGQRQTLKIHEAGLDFSQEMEPGSLRLLGEGKLILGFNGGALSLQKVQAPSKNPLIISEFLRGLKAKPERWEGIS